MMQRGVTTFRYNEALDEVGDLRTAYRAFQARTGTHPLHASPDSIARLAHRPLGDSYSIAPVPLVIDDHEYRHTISAGVRQRALALQAFFYDQVRGESAVLRATGLPEDLFARLAEQDGTSLADLTRWWHGKTREAVRFIYGPDLVRAPDGRWRILEDNVGCVGGVVDGQLALQAYLAHTGMSLHDSLPSALDLARAVDYFLARVGHRPTSARVVALAGSECDPESTRRRRVLSDLGVRVLNQTELQQATHEGLRSQDIDAVVNFDATGWVPASTLADEMFGQRNVPLMTAPGVGILGNKSLLPFVDDIVVFYSRTDPILQTASTSLYAALPADPTEWVLKESNSRQGRGVFFLTSMTDAAQARLAPDLSARGPACAVLQRRVSASFVPVCSGASWEPYQVELRPLVFVVGDGVCHVSEHACGRTFPATDEHGVGNLSQGAHYLPVIREPTTRS